MTDEPENQDEPEAEAPVSPEKTKWKQLKPAEWETIVVLWELGKVTVGELASMYRVTEQAIRRGLKIRGAKKGSRSGEIGEAAMEQAKSDTQKQIERIRNTKERFLQMNDLLAKLTIKEVSEAIRTGQQLATKKDNLAALQKASAVIARARHEEYHLLGLYDEETQDEELPELGIAEYSPDELEKIQRGFEVIRDEPIPEIDEADLALPFDDKDGDL